MEHSLQLLFQHLHIFKSLTVLPVSTILRQYTELLNGIKLYLIYAVCYVSYILLLNTVPLGVLCLKQKDNRQIFSTSGEL